MEELNFLPRVRWASERGRFLRGCLKEEPKDRWVREAGIEMRGWLNVSPKERWVREEGSMLGNTRFSLKER